MPWAPGVKHLLVLGDKKSRQQPIHPRKSQTDVGFRSFHREEAFEMDRISRKESEERVSSVGVSNW